MLVRLFFSLNTKNTITVTQRVLYLAKLGGGMSQTCRYQSSNANSHTLLRHVKIVRPSKSTKKIVDGKLNPHISSRSDVSDNSNIEEKLLNQVFEVKRETLDWFAREYRLRNVMKAVERQSSNHSVSNNINSNYQGIKDLNKEISRHINKYRGFCSKDITRIPSRILYCETWFSTFDKSDFEQMIPNFNGMLGDWSLKHEEMSFNLIRNRAAKDLSALKGYFLIFETIEMANIFLYETTGSEISGMQATFHFIDAELSDLEPEVIGVGNSLLKIQRDQCVLLSNVSNVLTKADILKYLWNYKLIHNDDLSVVFVTDEQSDAASAPVKTNKWLLRFEDSYEPHRFWRQQNGKAWTSCETPIKIELLD